MSELGQLFGVGLGPGDPELITVKGLKTLQEADVIFYPASKVEEGNIQSFSLPILEQLEVKTTCLPLHTPMTGKGREAFYQEAFEQVYKHLKQGKNAVIVSEGDILFYSTFGYLLALAKAKGVACQLVPGIPAFIAAAAQGEQALVEGKNGFKVIARPQDYSHLRQAINKGDTVVVMKMSVLKDWYAFLKKEERSFLYIEKVGTEAQFVTSEVEDLEDRVIPYFSLIIFYGRGALRLKK